MADDISEQVARILSHKGPKLSPDALARLKSEMLTYAEAIMRCVGEGDYKEAAAYAHSLMDASEDYRRGS